MQLAVSQSDCLGVLGMARSTYHQISGAPLPVRCHTAHPTELTRHLTHSGSSQANGGVPDVTSTPDVLDGRWRLLYTSRPGTASPIQNTFTVR